MIIKKVKKSFLIVAILVSSLLPIIVVSAEEK